MILTGSITYKVNQYWTCASFKKQQVTVWQKYFTSNSTENNCFSTVEDERALQ